MNLSSNQNMETMINQLENIQRVEAPADLYPKVHQKIRSIERRKNKIYSFAACMLLFLLGSEIYVAFSQYQSNHDNNVITSLIYHPVHQLYHE